MRVAVAGASGFIGRALGAHLSGEHEVIGLSRSSRAGDGWFSTYRTCDLFSLREAEQALEGADCAVYLVHSMMPSARLTQGSFEDLDLICADNFGRAAARAGVRQIVYLGGIVPDGETLSAHLASRLEVERALGSSGVPVTALRAGMVIGAGGSSFEIMLRLVRRLPAMACPRWTRTRTQPVALDDVVALLGWVLGREETFGASYDVAGPEVVTYEQMMTTLARLLDLDRPMMPVPLVSPALSRLWVTLVTGAPRELVAPLIRSLEHEMLARDDRLMRAAGRSPLGLEAALQRALAGAQPDEEPHAFVGARPRDPSLGRVAGGLRTALSDEQAERPDDDGARPPSRPTVRSVQRMALPDGATAAWAAREYVRWLPQALSGILHVAVEQRDEGAICRFVLGSASRRGRGLVLLELTHAPQRSGAGRQLFYVTGGALHHPHAPGERPARFELRQISDPHLLLTAIHDYQSRLPWFVYTSTQAVVHALVMEAFRRHLAERARLGPVPATESAGGEVLFSVPEVKGALPLEPPIGYDTPSHDAR